jgi:hypothetical protein
MSDELNFDVDQQADLRLILNQLHAYYKELYPPLFLDSEVLVGPGLAVIMVHLGEAPAGPQATDARSRRVESLKLALSDFYRELVLVGAPLIQAIEIKAEAVIARFQLIPNDPLGAERCLTKVIQRCKSKYGNQLQPA